MLEPREQVFSEHDIARAFQQCDVDGNGFVGVRDLSSVVGALALRASEREVDEMIRLVDTDGDGQIAFGEFRRMVFVDILGERESDFEARVEFKTPMAALTRRKASMVTAGNAAAAAAAAAAGAAVGAGAGSGSEAGTPVHKAEVVPVVRKARSLKVRKSMFTMMVKFVEAQGLGSDRLEDIYWRVIHSNPQGELTRLDYAAFCAAFECADGQLSRSVFDVFNEPDVGASVRLHVIAMAATLSMDTLSKTKFAFAMCDTAEQGTISRDSLADILRATHLLLYPTKEVTRKTGLIMTASMSKGDSIKFENFLSVSKKFPNVVFPVLGSVRASVG